jgi:CBS-domain-containing membrane protein
MSLDETLWTFVGVCIGFFTVSLIDILFQSTLDQFLILGPFGALLPLQYGVSGAPASQPRNVALDQVVFGALVLIFTYIPVMPPMWIRQIVAPDVCTSIGIMMKLGIMLPPAGAQYVNLCIMTTWLGLVWSGGSL